jgi:hypothetical protein
MVERQTGLDVASQVWGSSQFHNKLLTSFGFLYVGSLTLDLP